MKLDKHQLDLIHSALCEKVMHLQHTASLAKARGGTDRSNSIWLGRYDRLLTRVEIEIQKLEEEEAA